MRQAKIKFSTTIYQQVNNSISFNAENFFNVNQVKLIHLKSKCTFHKLI